MKGYKVFNPDWSCREMQYKVGASYEMDDKPVVCNRAFISASKHPTVSNSMTSIRKIRLLKYLGAVERRKRGNVQAMNEINPQAWRKTLH